MAKKVALGKGMASLLSPAMDQDVHSEVVRNALGNIDLEMGNAGVNESNGSMGPLVVDVAKIVTNSSQPRKIFKDKELVELADSIKSNGIIQPLIVCENDGKYELIAGERRLRAAKLAGLDRVPVVVKHGTTKQKVVMSIIENIQRSDLNCIEEGLAYFDLMETYKLTQEELSKELGKERSSIANYLRIIKLPREIVDHLRKEQLSFGHGKVLASIQDRDLAIRVAREAVEKQLSVRDIEKLAKNKARPLKEDRPLYSSDKLDYLKGQLEQKTGFHFSMKSKRNGSGQITIKFSNEAEFNDIFDYLIKR